MEKYIGEIIGAVAVIIAAIIGIYAKYGKHNKQTIKKVDNSTIYQANGDITKGDDKEKKKEK